MKVIKNTITLIGLSCFLLGSNVAFALPFFGGKSTIDRQYNQGDPAINEIKRDLLELALIAGFYTQLDQVNNNNQYNGAIALLQAYFRAHNEQGYEAGNEYGVHYHPYLPELPSNRNLAPFTQEAEQVRNPQNFDRLNENAILELLTTYFNRAAYDTREWGDSAEYYMHQAAVNIADFVIYRNGLQGAPEINAEGQDALIGMLRGTANRILNELDLQHRLAPGAFEENPENNFNEETQQVRFPQNGWLYGSAPVDTDLEALRAALQVLMLAEYAQIFGATPPSAYPEMFAQIRNNFNGSTTRTLTERHLILFTQEREIRHTIAEHLRYWANTGLERPFFVREVDVAEMAQAIANVFEQRFIVENMNDLLLNVPGFQALTPREKAMLVLAINRVLHRFEPDNHGVELGNTGEEDSEAEGGHDNGDSDEELEYHDLPPVVVATGAQRKQEDSEDDADFHDFEPAQEELAKEETGTGEKKKEKPEHIFKHEIPEGGRHSAPSSPSTERRARLQRRGSAPSLLHYGTDDVKADSESAEDEEIDDSDTSGYQPDSDEETALVPPPAKTEDLSAWNEELKKGEVLGFSDLTQSRLLHGVQKHVEENFHKVSSENATERERQRIGHLTMTTLTRAIFVELMGIIGNPESNGADVDLFIELYKQASRDIERYNQSADLSASMLSDGQSFSLLLTTVIAPIMEALGRGELNTNKLDDAIEELDLYIANSFGFNRNAMRTIVAHFTEQVLKEYQAALKAKTCTREQLQKLRMRIRIAINANADYYNHRAGMTTLSHSTVNNVLGIQDQQAMLISMIRVDSTIDRLQHALNTIETTLGALETFEEDFEEIENLHDEEAQRNAFARVMESIRSAREDARQAALKGTGSSETKTDVRKQVLDQAKAKSDEQKRGLPAPPPPPPQDWTRPVKKIVIKGKNVKTQAIESEDNTLTLQQMAALARRQMGDLGDIDKKCEANKKRGKKESEDKAGIVRADGGLILNANLLRLMDQDNLSPEKLSELNPHLFGDSEDDADWGDEELDTEKKNEQAEDEDAPTLEKDHSEGDLVGSITESVIKAGGLPQDTSRIYIEDYRAPTSASSSTTSTSPTSEQSSALAKLGSLDQNDVESFQKMATEMKLETLEYLLQQNLRNAREKSALKLLVQQLTGEQLVKIHGELSEITWRKLFGMLTTDQIVAYRSKTTKGFDMKEALKSQRDANTGDRESSDEERWEDDDDGSVYDSKDVVDIPEAYRNPRGYCTDDPMTAAHRGETLGYGPDWERRLMDEYTAEERVMDWVNRQGNHAARAAMTAALIALNHQGKNL